MFLLMKSSFLAISPPKNGDSPLYNLKRDLAAREKSREILAFPPVIPLGTIPPETDLIPYRSHLTSLPGLKVENSWEQGSWLNREALFQKAPIPGDRDFWTTLFPQLSWDPSPGVLIGVLPALPELPPEERQWRSWRLAVLEIEVTPQGFYWGLTKEINKKARS